MRETQEHARFETRETREHVMQETRETLEHVRHGGSRAREHVEYVFKQTSSILPENIGKPETF